MSPFEHLPRPAGETQTGPSLIALTTLLMLSAVTPLAAAAATVTHSAAGDVKASSAVVWGRCDSAGTLNVTYAGQGQPESTVTTPVSAAHDFAARGQLQRLTAATTYQYAVRCDDGPARTGELTTAPAPDAPVAARFAWSGDVGGQNVCRDNQYGYAIFDVIGAQRPAFFVALGDMIYADDPCQSRGRYGNAQLAGLSHPAVTLPGFWAVWRYHRSDAAFQRFLDRVPIVSVWDDHETLNDSGPHRDTYPSAPDAHLLPTARRAFLDYQPFVPPADDPTRIYRSVRWGKHLELFVLDTRQYRDANEAADDPQRPKTLLGAAQRAWLTRQIAASDATWKMVVSSVPISIPTCSGARGCDGWANHEQNTGFENELRAILQDLRAARVRNLVFLTTDVHFATGFRYTPFADERDFQLVEFVAGPLNAGVFPQHAFDLTLGTARLFFYGPPEPRAIASFEELRQWLNFGVIDISAAGDLRMQIINALGATVAEQTLVPR